jgi:hypothetical protein
MRALLQIGMMLCLSQWVVRPASADLVVNGGFETGDFGGWTQSGNTDGLSVVSTGFPNTGSYAADLGSQTGNFVLSQTLAVNPSTTYLFSFYLWQGADPDPASGYTNFFSAALDGSVVLSETNAQASGGYQLFYYVVTTGASDTTAVLAFDAHNDADYFHLDDVSVSAVPEPAYALLLAAGLAACLAAAIVRSASTR